LLDLGFAKAASNPGEAALTMQGAVLGSPAYMAPEQVIDSSSATTATDVYGLGATLYHCITGITPYNGRTVMEVMERVVRAPLVPPKQVKSDVPEGVQALILWAMDKEPENRPADAGMLLEAMQAVRQEPKNANVIFKRAGAGSPAWVWWIVGAVVVLAVLGILALFIQK
jgi:serine/threonine-protein kinase